MATPFPPVSQELVSRLAALFPDKCPNPSMSKKDIWMAVGAATVVKKLRAISEEQHTTVLEQPG